MDKLIDQFENETENPATWSGGGMGGYTKEFTEWLAEKVVKNNAVLPLVSNRRELLIAFDYWMSKETAYYLPAGEGMVDKFLENN